MTEGQRTAGLILSTGVMLIMAAGKAWSMIARGGILEWAFGIALLGLLLWGGLAGAEVHREYDRRGELLKKHQIKD